MKKETPLGAQRRPISKVIQGTGRKGSDFVGLRTVLAKRKESLERHRAAEQKAKWDPQEGCNGCPEYRKNGMARTQKKTTSLQQS